jgi:TolA-binding protein
MRPNDSFDTGLEPTAKSVAEFVAARVRSDPPADSGARSFLLRLAKFRQSQRRRRRFAAGVAVAVALFLVGLAGLGLRSGQPAPTLSYRANERGPLVGGRVVASESAESLLSFTDGSTVRMSARTRGRVVEVNSHGARFALEEGTISVDIVQRPRGQWLFEAGPFLITVHGTSFTVAWNPVGTVFELGVRTGSVSVASPLAGPEIHVRAGQSLKVSLHDRTTTTGPISSGDIASPAGTSTGASSAAPQNAAPQALAPMPPPSARWSHRKWPIALADGKAAAVVSDADQLGVAVVLQHADDEDLWALANAARYTGRYALAEQALTAQRKRFPASQRAGEAAFLLGRLHDGDSAGPGDALAWYERYLIEAPNGVHASDALGRKMTLLQRWNKRREALSVAEEYLRRFPAGTYANAAWLLVRAETAQP